MLSFPVNDNECAIYVENRSHCTPKHHLQKIAGINESNPKIILEHLKKETECDTELCIINSSKAKRELGGEVKNIINTYFKIEGPKHDIEKWLSNENIDKTLAQWARYSKFKHFYHIPFQMRDFEEQNTELATIDFYDLYQKNYRTFACVPNTDWSSGNGKHWFALFFDFRKEPYTLEYFNSSGECPLKEFNSWLNKKQQQLSNQFKRPVKKIVVTRMQNQEDDSSCGCYSMYYIYSRLNGIDWITFRTAKVTDERMYDFRKFLFNEENDKSIDGGIRRRLK